jgi:D-alanyl-D-alanine carboxypeptidase
VTLLDLLYAIMLNGSDDAAYAITKNLGALVYKKNQGEYFSPYDILKEPSKDEFVKLFLCLMNSAAKELNMIQTKFFNSHGII